MPLLKYDSVVPKDDKYEVYLESWLSGRKRLTANEVGLLKGLVGSNPTLSADGRKKRAYALFFRCRCARGWDLKPGARRREGGLSDFPAGKYG